MKRKTFILIIVLCYVISSCTTYKPFMSNATENPVEQKLPRMEIEWYSGDIIGANIDFAKTVIRNEMSHNIISKTGQKRGSIEVEFKKLHLKCNMAPLVFSAFTLYSVNLLGVPIAVNKIDVVLSFTLRDINGNVLDTYEYESNVQSTMGLYYGKDASVCMVEAVKKIMKKFRNDINSNAPTLIAKLDNNTVPISIYSAESNANKKETTLSDVDQSIPQTNVKASNTYALIIANEDYQFVDDVNFAVHDGEVFKEYCIKTLGIPERQIRYCANASYGVISGGVDWLKYALNNFDEAKAIVYYCGHGIPDEKTGDAYIIPVDGKGTNTTTCYSLNSLYTALANTKALNITYFMDACFTGANKEGGMLVAARGVAREAKKETLHGNSIVFSASSGDETAMTYPEKGHGMFTYFLLKKLQETSGNVSYSELATYIHQNVKKEAFLINEKPQTPSVATSMSATKSWKAMTFK